MCAANNKHPERKHFFFFCCLPALLSRWTFVKRNKLSSQLAARSFEFAARCRRSTLPCNRIEIKIPNPPESPVIVIDVLPLTLCIPALIADGVEKEKEKKGGSRKINNSKRPKTHLDLMTILCAPANGCQMCLQWAQAKL